MKTTTLILLGSLMAGASATARPKIVAGTGEKGFDPPGKRATRTQLADPFGIVRGPDGLLYICEFTGHCVRRLEKDGTLTTIAGIPGKAGFAGDGGPATEATLNKPHEIRFDSAGDLFISDMTNHVVRKVDMKSGTISTYAGTGGQKGFAGDGGPATEARFHNPISIQFDGKDNLYICDINNHRVRVVDPGTRKVRTFAGNGKKEMPEDGARFDGAPLKDPRTLDFDAAGDLWVVLRAGNAVYRLDLGKGTLHHVAGTGKKGFTGNGGPATMATLSGPKGIAIAPNGNVYLADTESHSVRMIDLSKEEPTMELVIGTGKKGPSLNQLARPHGVFIDKDGSLFIGDSENHRVLQIK